MFESVLREPPYQLFSSRLVPHGCRSCGRASTLALAAGPCYLFRRQKDSPCGEHNILRTSGYSSLHQGGKATDEVTEMSFYQHHRGCRKWNCGEAEHFGYWLSSRTRYVDTGVDSFEAYRVRHCARWVWLHNGWKYSWWSRRDHQQYRAYPKCATGQNFAAYH